MRAADRACRQASCGLLSRLPQSSPIKSLTVRPSHLFTVQPLLARQKPTRASTQARSSTLPSATGSKGGEHTIMMIIAREEMACFSRLHRVVAVLVWLYDSHGFERVSRLLHGSCNAAAVGNMLHGDEQSDIGVWVYVETSTSAAHGRCQVPPRCWDAAETARKSRGGTRWTSRYRGRRSKKTHPLLYVCQGASAFSVSHNK